MKKFTPIVLISLILAIVIIFSCDSKTDQVDGEVLVKEVWKAMKDGNIDFIENIMDHAFQSIHQDGPRNRDEEIKLIKGLQMGDYNLTDFVVTKNVNTMNVAYFVEVTETIDDVVHTKRSARLTVFSKTPEGWKWISHANLLPLIS
jgi:Domain of unknown function (DUF4440)